MAYNNVVSYYSHRSADLTKNHHQRTFATRKAYKKNCQWQLCGYVCIIWMAKTAN